MDHNGNDRQESENGGIPQHQVTIENGYIHEEVDHSEELLDPSDDHSPVEHILGDLGQ
jgi:hypothetical protein